MGSKSEQREPQDDSYILPALMKSKLEAPPVDSRNPIKFASSLPNATGSRGISVQNSFDRRAVASAGTDPVPTPPVNSLPDTGMTNAAYVSAPTQPTSSGNLTLQPRNPTPVPQQPPIQIVKNEQPAPVLTAPNPPVKIVGTTSEQTLQPTPAAIVVAQPQTPPVAAPIQVTPPVAAPIAAPELPKPAVQVAQPAVVTPPVAVVAPPVVTPPVAAPTPVVTAPVVNVPVVTAPVPAPAPAISVPVVESGKLLPLTSPLDSRPSGFGK